MMGEGGGDRRETIEKSYSVDSISREVQLVGLFYNGGVMS